jgi:hypothetical protein
MTTRGAAIVKPEPSPGLPHQEFVVRLWTNGVLEVSKTTIESLERLMKYMDFAESEVEK